MESEPIQLVLSQNLQVLANQIQEILRTEKKWLVFMFDPFESRFFGSLCEPESFLCDGVIPLTRQLLSTSSSQVEMRLIPFDLALRLEHLTLLHQPDEYAKLCSACHLRSFNDKTTRRCLSVWCDTFEQEQAETPNGRFYQRCEETLQDFVNRLEACPSFGSSKLSSLAGWGWGNSASWFNRVLPTVALDQSDPHFGQDYQQVQALLPDVKIQLTGRYVIDLVKRIREPAAPKISSSWWQWLRSWFLLLGS